MKSLPQSSIPVVSHSYRLEIQIVANPDFYQSFKPRKATIEAASLKELQTLQRQFIKESQEGISSDIPIGGGNWGFKCLVWAPDGSLVGRMSYNGRIWADVGIMRGKVVTIPDCQEEVVVL